MIPSIIQGLYVAWIVGSLAMVAAVVKTIIRDLRNGYHGPAMLFLPGIALLHLGDLITREHWAGERALRIWARSSGLSYDAFNDMYLAPAIIIGALLTLTGTCLCWTYLRRSARAGLMFAAFLAAIAIASGMATYYDPDWWGYLIGLH